MEKVLEDWTTITEGLLSDFIDFTPEEITNLLSDMGLVGVDENCRIEDLERYIFLYGNEQEIYGYEERSFIACVGSVYIYNGISRKTNKGTIATKIFAADLCGFEEGIKSCLFLMKVINKANDGFNVFLFKTVEGFFLGCRLYNKDTYKDCTLTEAIKYESEFDEILEGLSYLPYTDEFIPYYSALVETIECREAQLIDYDLKIMMKRGVNFSYLDVLSDIEKNIHINMDHAKKIYFETFDSKKDADEANDYSSILESLWFIKSDRTNTLELLFEAEEMALLANKTEEKNELIMNSTEERDKDSATYELLRKHLDDPEKMVKLLKEKRNIKT